MYTDTGMDTGDMLLKEEMEISENMTAGELHDCLSVMGARVLKDTLERLKNNTLVRTPQPEGEATYAPMMKKETGLIDWSLTALQIHNLVRGTNPWPGAYTFYKRARMRVWSTEIPDGRDGEGAAGRILRVDNSGIYVSSGKGAIRILEVQFDSGKRMKVLDYLRGHNIDEGEILG